MANDQSEIDMIQRQIGQERDILREKVSGRTMITQNTFFQD